MNYGRFKRDAIVLAVDLVVSICPHGVVCPLGLILSADKERLSPMSSQSPPTSVMTVSSRNQAFPIRLLA